MKNRNFVDYCKNAVGTVFLLAAAFFVCSTLVSMRAVLADPIAPVETMTVAAPQSARAGTTSRTSATSRANPRGTASTVSRGTTTRGTTTATRGTTARTATVTPVATTAAASAATTARTATASRGAVASRTSTATRTSTASRGTTTTARPVATSTRGVAARTATTTAPATTTARTATSTRGVTARTATASNTARVSLQGAAIRGSKTSSSALTYLSNKLYTGNYSNIIDSTTGMISAEAYSNCMESYYTCMDEICTARNESQGRCACAARTKAFAEAESALEKSNEELIKISGELALLVATNGKDVSAAFQLTDAEKIMNCAAYQEAKSSPNVTVDEKSITAVENWCNTHPEYTNNGVTVCSASAAPSYCSDMSTQYGFDINNLNGSSSDILASLKSWADAKDSAAGMITQSNTNLVDSITNVLGAVSGLGLKDALTGADTSDLDNIANTWGYDLFEFAHNNVCSRVLDSCFNGLYEACGTPPSGFKCANGSTASCPYNYNSKISVDSNGDIKLQERGTTTTSNSSSATCFGYTTTSGDPYSQYRGPVADARRSIMNKYLLDANAACDVYGDQLRATAQNVAYQKVAAQQALQQKRLEFAQAETTNIAAEYQTAISNFNKCLDEIYECYEKQNTNNTSWSTSRIKTYCTQLSSAPSCYETMVCGAPNSNLLAVISKLPNNNTIEGDKQTCANTKEYKTNTCRNIVTIAEVLSDSYANGGADGSPARMREQCLQNYGIDGIRNWSSTNVNGGWSTQSCNTGTHLEGTSCVPDVKTCSHSDANAANATQTWNASTQSWGGCTVVSCNAGYSLSGGRCIACPSGQHMENGACTSNTKTCTPSDANATAGNQTWDTGYLTWGTCTVTACKTGYQLTGGRCVEVPKEPETTETTE